MTENRRGAGATQGPPVSVASPPGFDSAAGAMPAKMPRALVLEDDSDALEAMKALVRNEGFTVSGASTVARAVELLAERPDVIVTDLMLPDGRGLDLLDQIEPPYDPDFVLVTGQATIGTAIEALRLGVSDYLIKPIDVTRLRTVLTTAARTCELKAQISTLRDELRKLGRFGPLVGASAPMSKVYDLIARVAPTSASVLVTGESGTGKEVVAQAIHNLSKRSRQPYIPLNCGAVSPSLIESELFGHEKGSFTGADRQHRGHFERASGGTLFLDEVTEMPIELQVKLLRVLETGKLTRLGGETAIEVDVRVIAASNREPTKAVADGKLREDLLYRLNVFPIELPPLRDRPGDVDLLVQHFLAELNRQQETAKQVTPEVLEMLRAHEWPGNVRELANTLQRAYILADTEMLPEHFPQLSDRALSRASSRRSVTSPADGSPRIHVPVGSSVASAEKALILATLEHFDGDKQKTSETLGVSLKTLYNRLNAYEGESITSPRTHPEAKPKR